MRGYNGDAQYEIQGLLREACHLDGFVRLDLSLDANDLTLGFVFSDFKAEVKFKRTQLFDCDEYELAVYVIRIIKGVRKSVC